MATSKNEKSLIAQVDLGLADKFQAQLAERGQKQKLAMSAAIKLWIELPVEIQARLLDQSMDSSAFISLVREIVDQRIQEGRKAARALHGSHKKRQAQKD
ncbi:MAG: hypothetical protein JXA82_18260 [Sedimentisphaerales bacterium]|nr:hypothetical protein [Sedimentisphaerales bacterium]